MLSDCQVVVALCHGTLRPTKNCFWKTVADIRELEKAICLRGNCVEFDWIPAHCGCALNELADQAAEAARSSAASHRPVSFHPVPLAVFKSFTRARLLAWTAQRW